jgi:DNA-binding protein H-NS
MMISNLQSARALIQADLDHARRVLELWTQQVIDLENALEQIDAVGESRKALKENYVGGRSAAPRLASTNTSDATPRGRRAKAEAAPAAGAKQQRARSQDRSADGGPSSVQGGKDGRTRKANKTAVHGNTRKVEAKYKDPNSDKTWSGRGRRPTWIVGNADKYRIQSTTIPHEATASSPVH